MHRRVQDQRRRAGDRRRLLGLEPRRRIPADVVVYQYFGISTDEAGRAERGKRRFAGVRHTIPVYPLIERGWSRSDCVAFLRDRLPYPVQKSSCVFCPYRTNQSWQRLRRPSPDGWARAMEIDAALRADDSLASAGDFARNCTCTGRVGPCRRSTSARPGPEHSGSFRGRMRGGLRRLNESKSERWGLLSCGARQSCPDG